MNRAHDLPEGSVLLFPEGLPGFETARQFVLLRHEEFEPMLLLQNVEDNTLSVPVIPAQFVDSQYNLQVPPGDAELLGFAESPRLGGAVVCLLVLVLAGQGGVPKCNLFAPIVINPANLRAKQIMQIGSSYSSLFPLTGPVTGASRGG